MEIAESVASAAGGQPHDVVVAAAVADAAAHGPYQKLDLIDLAAIPVTVATP